jgi:hypothetical protein
LQNLEIDQLETIELENTRTNRSNGKLKQANNKNYQQLFLEDTIIDDLLASVGKSSPQILKNVSTAKNKQETHKNSTKNKSEKQKILQSAEAEKSQQLCLF